VWKAVLEVAIQELGFFLRNSHILEVKWTQLKLNESRSRQLLFYFSSLHFISVALCAPLVGVPYPSLPPWEEEIWVEAWVSEWVSSFLMAHQHKIGRDLWFTRWQHRSVIPHFSKLLCSLLFAFRPFIPI